VIISETKKKNKLLDVLDEEFFSARSPAVKA